MQNFNYRRYFVALILSILIFSSGFLVSNMLTSQKLENLRQVEDNISTTILSSETEYEMLKDIACDAPNVTAQTTLNSEIGDLAERLELLESANENDERIIAAKKRYSLLLMKDFLLSRRISENCKTKPAFVIYFYGNADICPECVKTGAALTSLRDDYERLRVYSFDMNLDLPLIRSFAKIYGISNESLPAIVVDKKVYGGLTTKEEIDKLIPKEIKTNISTGTKQKVSLKKIFNELN